MKDLRCSVMWHKYIEKHSPDGGNAYLECRRCGKFKDILEVRGSPEGGIGP